MDEIGEGGVTGRVATQDARGAGVLTAQFPLFFGAISYLSFTCRHHSLVVTVVNEKKTKTIYCLYIEFIYL
jgi:hypothetical protein